MRSPVFNSASVRSFEWPTWLLIATIYTAWMALTLFWNAIPIWALWCAGAFVTCWYGHLQHELIHGHPTRHHFLNDLFGYAPLALWVPYPRYKQQHIAHHRSEVLADPIDDPESFYITQSRWNTFSPIAKRVLTLNNTFLGRLVIGPFLTILSFWRSEAVSVFRNEGNCREVWAIHIATTGLVIVWVTQVCQMPLWVFLSCFVYPGTSLLLVRSFLEHRPAEKQHHRTAIVEGCWLTRLLFLCNNLHVIHHARPDLAWYKIPAVYERNKDSLRARNGGYVFKGYGEVAARYLLTPKDSPAYPTSRM